MTWFNIQNQQNDVLDISIIELSWDPDKLDPLTNKNYGEYGVLYAQDNGATTSPQYGGSRYSYMTAMRFNTKKVICGEDFIDINSTYDYLLNTQNIKIDNSFIIIEGDYTYKLYNGNTNDYFDISKYYTTDALKKYQTARSPLNIGSTAIYQEVFKNSPNNFSVRLMNNNIINNNYIFSRSLNRDINSSTSTITAVPFPAYDSTNYEYSVPIYAGCISRPWSSPGPSNISIEANNLYSNKSLLKVNPVRINEAHIMAFSSRLRNHTYKKDYTMTIYHPHSHYFSLCYNSLLESIIPNSSFTFPYISFNINCTKNPNSLISTSTCTDLPGYADSSLQQLTDPLIDTTKNFMDPNNFRKDLIKNTYLKITKININ